MARRHGAGHGHHVGKGNQITHFDLDKQTLAQIYRITVLALGQDLKYGQSGLFFRQTLL